MINYCMAAWSGNRKDISFDDSYLRKHLQHLDRIKHNLSQISIGHPENPEELPQYTEYLNQLSKMSDGTPIVVYDMPNGGMSYGQWSNIFNECKDQFTHYVFIEDDYVPVIDHFDSILVDMFEEKYKSCNCGYLCGLVFDKSSRYGRRKPCHAGVSNGITSAKVLQKVMDKFDTLVPTCLPRVAQVKFSETFLLSGYTLSDYLDRYQTPYYCNGKKLQIFEAGQESIIVPIQCLDTNFRWNIQNWTENGKQKTIRNALFR